MTAYHADIYFCKLPGFSANDPEVTRFQDQNLYYDELPLLWRRLSEKNYVTGFAEDTPYSTFNYQRKGFKIPVSN